MKTILVTGGAGFIGSHTCCSLLEEGFELYILDSLVNSSEKSLEKLKEIFERRNIDVSKKINFFKGDLRNKDIIDNVFKFAKENNKPIDGVIHFAGLKAVQESVNDPLLYWENNVIGSYNLIKSMEENNCLTIVFSSSATVYGISSNEFLTETCSVNPINPYGSTKLTIENLLNDLTNKKNKKWRIAILRYFNPIGSHPSGLIGENPLQKPNNIFPIIINSAFENKNLRVFGNDWGTPDGTCIRDYIHVMDLAESHLRALNFLFQKNNEFITLNIGTGRGISVLELIETFEKTNNVKVPFSYDKRREGDVARLVADNAKVKLILNWSPKFSLEEMCRSGWAWKCSNPGGFYDV